ncbi:MAG: response regulator [Proteobacteria bacterium]|nr:response regulator [Pseudomonadota bacterium]MBU1687526.1 response regulator [Pseudomonadota bacterium]
MDPFLDTHTVLLIEDEPTQRRLVSNQLSQRGFEVLEAANGREGLFCWRENPKIRLVITDLQMPEMDGFEVIRTIRQEESRYTYIIVLTGLDNRKALVEAMELGADDFLHKPVHGDELKLRLIGASRLIRLEGLDQLVFGLAEMAGSRSGETGLHLRRVQEYCRLLATNLMQSRPELQLTPALVNDMATVSSLHDIGKVGIPDAILHKPDRLTDEEYEQMKRHTTIGGKLLWDLYQENGSNFLKMAYQIAVGHHEKWDGTGYPRGMKGEEIPLAARIMALADVYDALTSTRCYKDAFSAERAKAILIEGNGTQFDPKLLESFLASENDWLKVKAQIERETTNVLD